MLYALVSKPKIDTSKIDVLRKKYDPYIDLMEPHITLVFPISDESIDKEILINHTKNILQDVKAFKIHLSGLEILGIIGLT